VSERIL